MSHDWFESSLKYKLMSNSLSNILSNILIACLLLFVFAILPNIFFSTDRTTYRMHDTLHSFCN